MNSIATDKELSNFIRKTLVEEFGWKKLSMTRAEAFGFLQKKQEEADELGVRLLIVENVSFPAMYVGRAFDSEKEKRAKWFEISEDSEFKKVIGFQPSPEDFESVLIELTEKPKPKKPTKVASYEKDIDKAFEAELKTKSRKPTAVTI